MMKRNSKLIIGTILVIAIISFSTMVFADNTTPVIIGGNSATTQNTTTDNTQSSNTTNTTYNTLNTSTTYNRTNTTNTTLPQTGVTDGYVVAILVAVCAISAIYAYKKIRDYKNI